MLIYLIAGEPSGDLLGSQLMRGLKALAGESVQFAGIGGESMCAEGLTTLFPMSELSVMGLVEVVPRIPQILRRVKQTVADIGSKRPQAILTIDSWGFTGRVQTACQRQFPEIARVHYVAPMVWAWKPHRTKTLAAVLDLLLTLLPFEPPWFEKEGLRSVHVGHPVIGCGAGQGDGEAFRLRHQIPPAAPVLVALPGSRHSETKALLPVFSETVHRLKATFPDLVIAVPTVETVVREVRSVVAQWPGPTVVVTGREAKYDCFAAGTVALAASGTVVLELAMAELPTVVTYKVSKLTAFAAVHLLGLKARWASLPNLILEREIITELLQERCRPDLLAEALSALLRDPEARLLRRLDMREAIAKLGQQQEQPGGRAAEVVLQYLAERHHTGEKA